ncbi:MAG: hypothetical protein PVH24_02075 [Candidatus Zixiibacteriota bacterium]
MTAKKGRTSMATRQLPQNVKKARIKKKRSDEDRRREQRLRELEEQVLQDTENHCINCGSELTVEQGVRICRKCNSREDVFRFVQQFDENEDFILIECPGATLYEEDSDTVAAGVEFLDEEDPLKGYRIVGKPVYPPTHTRWRRIRKDALGKIRRCQACQDYTIRMRRKEGCDFFIPSHKYPGRKKLKSITHSSSESGGY